MIGSFTKHNAQLTIIVYTILEDITIDKSIFIKQVP